MAKLVQFRELQLTSCEEETFGEYPICLVSRNGSSPSFSSLMWRKIGQTRYQHFAPNLAAAIVAFQTNNGFRGVPIKSFVVLDIAMVGMFPSFYQAKVTQGLDEVV